MSETSSRVRLMANLQAAVAEAVSGTMEERGRGFASDREAWAELKECIERTKQMHTDIEKVHTAIRLAGRSLHGCGVRVFRAFMARRYAF